MYTLLGLARTNLARRPLHAMHNYALRKILSHDFAYNYLDELD